MTDPLSVARRYFDAWNRHDGAAIVATFADGGTYSDPSAPSLGGEAIAQYAGQLWAAFPDLAFEVDPDPVVHDGLVAAQWRMTGTNTGPFRALPPSGRTVSLTGADFIRVEGGKIRSVTGYFDGGEVPRQLGLQVIVQPQSAGPFRFGVALAAQSGNREKPGAFGITSIHARSEEESQRIRDYSRRIVGELMSAPGFIGWSGMTFPGRQLTVTAWDDPESARQLMSKGAHAEAMKEFFASDLAVAAYTSIWTPERINATWIRCSHCGRMANYETGNGQCDCGHPLNTPPPYW